MEIHKHSIFKDSEIDKIKQAMESQLKTLHLEHIKEQKSMISEHNEQANIYTHALKMLSNDTTTQKVTIFNILDYVNFYL